MIELQSGEYIIKTLRKHWFLFVVEIAGLVLLFAIPFIFSVLPFSLPFVGTSTATFFGVLWLLIIWMRTFIVWTNYYLDIWVVTNMRLVDVEQVSLFNRRVSTLELENIEDITVRIEGFFESVIGYGTLSVQTAGMVPEFIIKDIFAPEEAKKTIYTTQRLAKQEDQERMTTVRIEEKQY
jgi:hypothetical protein